VVNPVYSRTLPIPLKKRDYWGSNRETT